MNNCPTHSKFWLYWKFQRNIHLTPLTPEIQQFSSRNCIYLDVITTLNLPTFWCSKSSASCSPTAFMSVFCSALVMYMCISRNRSIAPPSSACSISSCESRFTNHSNDCWSRLIQKKSTLRRFMIVGGISLDHSKLQRGQQWRAFQYRCMIDWRIEANGVTPMPVAIRMACCAWKM